ncbi:psoriasis susceptibility 1 candidate gene 2 protein [Emys orbicularis]|uniref:psoriasis susceptibility 1 candidate gene 2 protein n=1 Tax=Emys orbicularis TaxID=82168 RepID=UPI0031FBF3B1
MILLSYRITNTIYKIMLPVKSRGGTGSIKAGRPSSVRARPPQGADVRPGAPRQDTSEAQGGRPSWPELPRAHYEEEPPEPVRSRRSEGPLELPLSNPEGEAPPEPLRPCCYPEEPPENHWPDFPTELPDLPPSPGREEPALMDWTEPDATDEVL